MGYLMMMTLTLTVTEIVHERVSHPLYLPKAVCFDGNPPNGVVKIAGFMEGSPAFW